MQEPQNPDNRQQMYPVPLGTTISALLREEVSADEYYLQGVCDYHLQKGSNRIY